MSARIGLPLVLLLAFCTHVQCVAASDSGTLDPTVRTSGSLSSTDVSAKITITYDEFGVPTVTAATRLDAYFAEGYLHAQNRYTQMDLSRRFAAGELSELVGAAALGRDRSARKYRMRQTASAVIEMMDDAERTALFCSPRLWLFALRAEEVGRRRHLSGRHREFAERSCACKCVLC